ncbi:MAG: ABC transporter ATP-binding protein [Chloroflexota bacterium]
MSDTLINSPASEDEAAYDRAEVAPTPPAIETRGLRKVYNGIAAVQGLALQVGPGEVFGFLGPNGAGKSTVVKMLTGLVRPTDGDAMLLGRPLGDREAKRRIGYLPELFRFHDWLSAREFLDVHGRLSGLSGDIRAKRIVEVLERVGLENRADDRLRTFSKGMQQRAGLAQAILHDPDIVFLDEPTSALDPIGRRIVRDVIRSLRDQGKTVFLNSHLLSEVEMVCDRVAILNRGELVAIGRLDELIPGDVLVDIRLGAVDDGVRDIVAGHGKIVDLESVSRDTTVIRVLVAGDRAIAELTETLVGAGVKIYGVTPSRPDLEDLFVELVDQSDGLDVR